MQKIDTLIYGGGKLGKQIHFAAVSYFKDKYNILGFIDDTKDIGEKVIEDLEIVGSLKEVKKTQQYNDKKINLLFAIGYGDMQKREVAFHNAINAGYDFESLIHPNAMVEKNVKLGVGVYVSAGAVVDQYSIIGDATYIDIGVLISEDVCISTNNFIAAGTTIGGHVKIGKNNFIGMNTTVVDNLTISDNNIINSRAFIYRKIKNGQKVVRYIEQREFPRD